MQIRKMSHHCRLIFRIPVIMLSGFFILCRVKYLSLYRTPSITINLKKIYSSLTLLFRTWTFFDIFWRLLGSNFRICIKNAQLIINLNNSNTVPKTQVVFFNITTTFSLGALRQVTSKIFINKIYNTYIIIEMQYILTCIFLALKR